MDGRAARGLTPALPGSPVATVSSRCCSVRPGVVDLDPDEQAALQALAGSGLVPPLRLIPGPDRFVTCSRRRTGEATRDNSSTISAMLFARDLIVT